MPIGSANSKSGIYLLCTALTTELGGQGTLEAQDKLWMLKQNRCLKFQASCSGFEVSEGEGIPPHASRSRPIQISGTALSTRDKPLLYCCSVFVPRKVAISNGSGSLEPKRAPCRKLLILADK